MSTCPQHIIDYMHEYLDGDISREHEQVLKQHLKTCTECQQHMHQLSDTIAFIKSAAHITAPPHFEEKVMKRLPRPKSRVGVQKWLRRHPFLVAAAMFVLFMSATLFGSFNDDKFSVTKQPNLIVEGQTVIVPEGEVVKGDIVVKNGDIVVEGEVDGNIIVINGEYMASTAVVSGQIQEIDQVFEWIWYEIKRMASDFVTLFEKDEE
ncbi:MULTISPECIES: anti-sigma factor family protein [Ureibacillus]|jgi:anti-sigma factor RsiW|uniref:Anti-sigma-W factor RsiW n=1 Tax=Ureibacillus thermosphaericus TaxID=51173 RepID=A0A840Q1V1_URETH|nr:anti-sigma factor [Ureibacillus thermosphaericus]MBB5150438.1 anti-sigma factor RsiW [Ureibacillus thermosphaericus]NKZ33068.1 anti-sigma factor [Ureibacillus thermosphaericus]